MSFALQINVQTDNTDEHPSLPPPTKVLKNKALLCKPLVQNKGVSCKTQTADCGAQTGRQGFFLDFIPFMVMGGCILHMGKGRGHP